MPTLSDLPEWHDSDSIEAALFHVKQWGCAIDVGAHVGIFACAMLERFDRVIAFEPQPDNFAALKRRVERFGNRCDARNMAISDKSGPQYLAPGLENTGQWHLTMDRDGVGSLVAVGPLDVVVKPSQAPGLGLIKIDVEGLELRVLQGAQALMSAYKPVIMIEENGLCKRYGIRDGEAIEFLEEMGARVLDRVNNDVVMGWP